ncbi:MAG: hypothetical protein LAT54_07285 [Cryomorphaceae bacterium]|nr:hypothetical protein [Cryomorphaceae bacterium]
MESTKKIIESLIGKTESYGKIKYELLKLKALDKTSDVTSRFLSRTLLFFTLSFFVLFINIGLSFWIGELLGKVYYGFAVIAGVYGLISIVLIITHKSFIRNVKNKVIFQLSQ